MEDKENSKSESLTMNTFYEKLIKILDNPDITGEIQDQKNALVAFLKEEDNWKKLENSKIKYSYTNDQTIWKQFRKKDKDEIYLFRTTKKLDKKIKDLIRSEYKIHEDYQELNNISPKFICYYLSNFFNFSLFIIKDFYTLEEILKNKKLVDLSDKDSFLKFSKEELLTACTETIKNLNLDDKKFFICPFLTPSNLLYTDTKQYFLLSEIFLDADSSEEEKEKEIILKDKKLKKWLVPEFKNNKAKLSFSSNIYCLGNLFYKISFNKNPEKDIKIEENSLFKKLIENCLKINKEERWSIEEVDNYINENNFEEEEKDDNNENEI